MSAEWWREYWPVMAAFVIGPLALDLVLWLCGVRTITQRVERATRENAWLPYAVALIVVCVYGHLFWSWPLWVPIAVLLVLMAGSLATWW